MRPIRVLIVDDQALFAEALAARLGAEHDLEVLPVAHDIRRATALIATEAPQVVVLDLVLGEESGLDALDLIRRRYPDVRVVVLSGITDIDPMVTALRHGAVGWLPKTESADLVSQVIRRAAGRGGWIPPTVLGEVLRRLFADGAPDTDDLAELTPRERQVLRCMVDGLKPAGDRRPARAVGQHRPHPHAEPPRQARRALRARGDHGGDACGDAPVESRR